MIADGNKNTMEFRGSCYNAGLPLEKYKWRNRSEAIKLCDDYAIGTIRISLGKGNSVEEVNEIANAIASIVNR